MGATFYMLQNFFEAYTYDTICLNICSINGFLWNLGESGKRIGYIPYVSSSFTYEKCIWFRFPTLKRSAITDPGFYKALMEWAKSGLRESDEEMAEIVYDLVK